MSHQKTTDKPDSKTEIAAAIRFFAKRFPALDTSAITSFLALRRLTSDLFTAFDAHFARHDLSKGRFMILLNLLKSENGLSPADLAMGCEVSRATMTGLLDTLEASGHITREQNTDDRRGLMIRLTPQGEAVLNAMLPDHYRRLEGLMRSLSKEEREQLVRLCAKVEENIASIRDP
jgi:DNA-binding MarR family transcriptional regulator